MIEVSVSRDGVEDDEPPSTSWVDTVVRRTLSVSGVKDSCEVSVLLTQEAKIQELNREYRNQDKPTDVLSFAFEEESSMICPPGMPRVLGDVILSLPTIRRQALANQKTYAAECAWALCHGVLHLLGQDHQTDVDDRKMRALEEKVLSGLEEGFLQW